MPCITKTTLRDLPRKRKRVELAELGQDAYVYVREMTAKQYHAMSKLAKELAANGKLDADEVLEHDYVILSDCLVDEDGNRLFDSPDDVRQNADFGLEVLKKLATEILNAFLSPDPKN